MRAARRKLPSNDLANIFLRQATPLKVYHPRAFSSNLRLEDARKTSSKKMGQLWSAPLDEISVKSTTLTTQPTGKLCDALGITVCLQKEHRDNLRQFGVHGQWAVDLEVDIANFRKKHHLHTIETTFQKDEEQICIPSDAFAVVMKQVCIRDVCNICAIHICLLDSSGKSLGKIDPVVMDVSHGGYNAVDSVYDLKRRLYGVHMVNTPA